VYALAWVCLAAALGSLVYGVSQPGLTFIWISIGASIITMLLLLAGVLRGKRERPPAKEEEAPSGPHTPPGQGTAAPAQPPDEPG
jgi:hypothetical protein